MKPINCKMCGYLEKVDSNGYSFCMKSYRMIDDLNKKADDCPLNERPKDNADKKGFYLVENDAG
jgi:hypothetical protein